MSVLGLDAASSGPSAGRGEQGKVWRLLEVPARPQLPPCSLLVFPKLPSAGSFDRVTTRTEQPVTSFRQRQQRKNVLKPPNHRAYVSLEETESRNGKILRVAVMGRTSPLVTAGASLRKETRSGRYPGLGLCLLPVLAAMRDARFAA